MRMWIIPALLALYVMPRFATNEDKWNASEYEIFLFESPDKRAMAVVTPDPFFSADGADPAGVRAWRAEVHVRVGASTVSGEVRFMAESITETTLTFIETAWGREVHVFETHSDSDSGHVQRRRWLARAEGLEEILSGG